MARRVMQKNGLKRLEKIEAQPLSERNYRRLTTTRLRHKLDLEKYNNPSTIIEEPIQTDRLYISLSQNIGIKSVAAVSENQKVAFGDILADAPEGSLGLPIHCPTDGIVERITDDMIIVKSAERKISK